MKYEWIADFEGEPISVELATAPLGDFLLKFTFLGLLGSPKARGTLLYGNQLVESRQIPQHLIGVPDAISTLDLVGQARRRDGREMMCHARIEKSKSSGDSTSAYFFSYDCKITVDGKSVAVRKKV